MSASTCSLLQYVVLIESMKKIQASQLAQGVKNPPAMQETQEMRVRSVSWKDPLEEGVETHSSDLAWEIPWTEEPGGLRSMGSQRVGHN